jgi:hypothetical protein
VQVLQQQEDHAEEHVVALSEHHAPRCEMFDCQSKTTFCMCSWSCGVNSVDLGALDGAVLPITTGSSDSSRGSEDMGSGLQWAGGKQYISHAQYNAPPFIICTNRSFATGMLLPTASRSSSYIPRVRVMSAFVTFHDTLVLWLSVIPRAAPERATILSVAATGSRHNSPLIALGNYKPVGLEPISRGVCVWTHGRMVQQRQQQKS